MKIYAYDMECLRVVAARIILENEPYLIDLAAAFSIEVLDCLEFDSMDEFKGVIDQLIAIIWGWA